MKLFKLDRSKQAVQARRMRYVAVPLVTALLYVVSRHVPPIHAHGFLIDSAANWPSFVRNGWPPLNIVEIAVSLWCLLVFLDKLPMRPGSLMSTLRHAVGAAMGVGLLGAIFGTVLSGWYLGLALFVLVTCYALGAMLALGIFMGVVFGGGWLIGKAVKWLWNRYLRETRFGHLVRRVGDYFNAEDVANGTSPEANTNH
ncbi:MAG TPA: hypothetical protein VLF91_02385 [Candidatus Saccharimonadales bacterium]|nr:hypothetical protein [Candidatus Saccharimonadales bacterium]